MLSEQKWAADSGLKCWPEGLGGLSLLRFPETLIEQVWAKLQEYVFLTRSPGDSGMQPVIGASSAPIGFFLSRDYNFLQGKYATLVQHKERCGGGKGEIISTIWTSLKCLSGKKKSTAFDKFYKCSPFSKSEENSEKKYQSGLILDSKEVVVIAEQNIRRQ